MEIENEEHVRQILVSSFQVYNTYSWLLDSFVLDFFTDNHWSKLPKSWQTSLNNLDPHFLANLLNYDEPLSKDKVWPLSLIALKTFLVRYSIPRKVKDFNIGGPYFKGDENLLKLFWRNVKQKKRHEISIMSKICYKSATETNCFYIVDIGSGLGHLSRMLNYGYNFKEKEFGFTELSIPDPVGKDFLFTQYPTSNHYGSCGNCYRSKKLDYDFGRILQRKFPSVSYPNKSVHVNMRIKPDVTENEFLSVIKEAFNIKDNNFPFGIVGLHPCGDLGATLLRLYKNCDNAKYINIVGCCYMKLSSSLSSPYQGFPLSQFCKNMNYDLSYHSREIACHAIENYIAKLEQGECWKLKIHTYRALIEKFIVALQPELNHSALSNVKYVEDLTFENYCQKATKKLKLSIPSNYLKCEMTVPHLNQWKNVVVFYSLRLLLAPFIETLILLDRLLYVNDSGINIKCAVIPVFNSGISPRNHVLSVRRM